ncbi:MULTISPECIES: GreA/GreB family elongation factor [unclassified Vibrio]|uniref:GreA/GreB family elongation factor n=1 Tax=unclassified Vibrio TaxID=2614977 RepID=UPI00136151E0|nr:MULTISPECIES: GreA/GreB family elongation factor [unclassified Vibrio]NAW56951.1 transcription elongation factor [Vibrio sp. V36_P2S2PM302]NAX27540.1 transcription elongation factor [Vibrio sp. V38_P2S17PM301]NAX28497.1 transcription elongation factor [Vibrio sp. V37_P2S8PM304]
MNKSDLQQKIVAQLEEQLQVARSATQRAIDTATDEETVPEHKYDTLALEAAYLAHGQAMRVQACEEELRQFRQLCLRNCDDGKITMSAYVELEDEAGRISRFFIGPCAGGLEVEWQGEPVKVMTPQAPLGKALYGAYQGDDIEFRMGEDTIGYQVVTVS